MKTSAKQRTVLVIGGGIGGLAAALAMARLGIHVTVLEPADAIGEIGAGTGARPRHSGAHANRSRELFQVARRGRRRVGPN